MNSEERDRLAELWDALNRMEDDSPDGSDAALLRTFEEDTYPGTAVAVYACYLVSIGCDEVEGATPAFAPLTDQVVYAVNAGTQIPNVGTDVIAIVSGGRWVFRWDTPPL